MDEAIDEFGGGRRIGIRDDESVGQIRRSRIENVVIDDQNRCSFLHILDEASACSTYAFGLVEIGTNKEVCVIDDCSVSVR